MNTLARLTVSLVTHCYGPFYALLLAQQLRSLAGRDDVRATVFVWSEETHLLWEATGIQNKTTFLFPANVTWAMSAKPDLLNRTIGRNIAAKQSTVDWVWFTDCDYLFGPGSLESLAKLDPNSACMYYPQTLMRPGDTDYFDDWPEGVDPLSRCTIASRQRRAIGGIQIVPGHLARQYGYLDGVAKYHHQAVGDKMTGWRADQAYRGWLADKTKLPIVAADIPNVYRLRHRIPETSDRAHLLPMEG